MKYDWTYYKCSICNGGIGLRHRKGTEPHSPTCSGKGKHKAKKMDVSEKAGKR